MEINKRYERDLFEMYMRRPESFSNPSASELHRIYSIEKLSKTQRYNKDMLVMAKNNKARRIRKL